MRQLLHILLIVIFAVFITLFAQGNDAKVLLFVSNKRIELSLNLAIIGLLFGFFLFHYSLLALRFSAQLSTRFRGFFSNRKQKALLQANTNAFIAWITEDEQESNRALQQAISTGLETELSYLIRAMWCLQTHRLDEAEQVLSSSDTQYPQHAFAVNILRIKILLARRSFAQALNELDGFDVQTARFPMVRKLRLWALVKLERCAEALVLIDGLLEIYPNDQCLLELAGEVFNKQGLFDQAIAQFEKLYAQRASAQYALKLSHLYSQSGQAEKAEDWKKQSDAHL